MKCTLIAIILIVIAPHLTVSSANNPEEDIIELALIHGMKPSFVLAKWHVECSKRWRCPVGLDGERGPFQMALATIVQMECDFDIETLLGSQRCMIRYWKRGKRICGWEGKQKQYYIEALHHNSGKDCKWKNRTRPNKHGLYVPSGYGKKVSLEKIEVEKTNDYRGTIYGRNKLFPGLHLP